MLANTSSIAPPYWVGPVAYNTEALLEDVSKQMAASNLTRRLSRGSAGSKGGSMRIVKTTSAGISPRNSTALGRRRTLMSDSPYRRRPMILDQNGMLVAAPSGPHDRMQPPPMPSRPVSWHATSHLAPQSSYQMHPAYPHAQLEVHGPYQNYDLAPTSAACSAYASPGSTLSPLSQPFTNDRHQPLQLTDDSFYPNHFEPANQPYPTQQLSEESLQLDAHSFSTDNMDPSLYSHFDWDNFATNGFADVTAPPTPDDFLPIQRPDPSFGMEESIPFHSLDDDSVEAGEVLVGMGLYDTPEKSPISDPHLDNYRSTMMTQLLGPGYRKPEATLAVGKGLKLEETWKPPPSDDGDEDGDEDEDAEGSEADDPPAAIAEPSPRKTHPTVHVDAGFLDNNALEGHPNGWL